MFHPVGWETVTGCAALAGRRQGCFAVKELMLDRYDRVVCHCLKDQTYNGNAFPAENNRGFQYLKDCTEEAEVLCPTKPAQK